MWSEQGRSHLPLAETTTGHQTLPHVAVSRVGMTSKFQVTTTVDYTIMARRKLKSPTDWVFKLAKQFEGDRDNRRRLVLVN